MPSATWDNLDAAKKARVLQAAMREFGTHGFSPGSLNVVAREAGVAKGSLFQYFTDKLDFYAVVCDAVSTGVRDEMAARMAACLPRDLQFFDRIEAVMRLWVDYFADHPLERGITVATNFEIDPEVREAVRRVAQRHYLEVLDPLLVRAVDRGEISAGADTEVLSAYLLWLFPHVAVAPAMPALDAVLGLHGQTPHELSGTIARLVAPLRAAFAIEERPARCAS